MWRNKNIETYRGCDCGYDEAQIVLFGAPYDGTTSYRPGTRFASRVMRSESYSLESYSPYLDRDLTDYGIFDSGDLELSFGDPSKPLKTIEQRTQQILLDEKKPVMIGGEHLVTLGAVRAAAKEYRDLAIIHFDAHADLRAEYMGESLSHATVMRRCWELVGDNRIYQFGIRSGNREEFTWGKDHVRCTKYDFSGLMHTVELLQGKPVYLTIDLDVLDPSIFPGTGTPEAGGVGFRELLAAITAMGKLNIVACDLNELAPNLDPSGASTAVALKTLRELLLTIVSV